MAVTIKLKNASGSDPSASDLVVGEVALRTDSGKLFTKKDDGSVAQIGGGAGAIDDDAVTTAKIADNAVTLDKIQDFNTNRIAGRVAGGTGSLEQLNASQVRAMINVEDGATADQTKSDIDALGIAASTATTATNVVGVANSANSEYRVPFLSADTGTAAVYTDTDSGMTYNPSTNTLSAVNFIGNGSSVTNVNAATLDGLDSSQFLRSDTSDNLVGNLSISAELNFLSSSDTSRYIDAQVGTADGTHAFHIRAVTGGDSGHENMAQFFGGGGVKLFHNGSSKFETTSAGVSITGTCTLSSHLVLGDSDEIKLGASEDLLIFHNGSHSIINDNGTGDLRLQVGSSTKLKVTSAGIHVQGSQEPQIVIQDSDSGNTGNAAETGISFKDGGGTQQGIMGFSNSGDQDFYFDTASTSGEMNFRVGGSTTQFKVDNSGIGITGNITVSGTVDGRDVASDGSKLDGIESGATADQSASEILTLIKTVDGSGSGLDADTLDGANSSVSASNGTIVQRHSSGYIFANYINTTDNSVSSSVSGIICKQGDSYHRTATAAAVRSFLNVADGANNITNNNQLSNGAGYITSGSNRAAQAWVNFKGSGTVTIRDEVNVSSISDNGTGQYTVNFSSSMSNANYCIVNGYLTSQGNANTVKITSQSSGSFSLKTGSFQDGSGNTNRDYDSVYCAIFED